VKQALLILALLLAADPAGAATLTIEASQDTTLIEDAAGAWANGSGPALFLGRTNQREGSIRRTLILFDLSAELPRNARIERVALRLAVTPSHPEPRLLRLHRLLADWGEGPSYASGGGGAPSGTGDATWIDRLFDEEAWTHPGGHFVARVSAESEVADAGSYLLEDDGLMHDVRLWAAAPDRNYGWILIGDEAEPGSSKSLGSREESDPTLRPLLEVTWSEPDTH
jgi:hypothetical protein